MRNKNFDVDLLKTLNEQPMPAAPLTDDEFARVLDAACAKLPQEKKTVKRRFPWGRVQTAKGEVPPAIGGASGTGIRQRRNAGCR